MVSKVDGVALVAKRPIEASHLRKLRRRTAVSKLFGFMECL